MPDGPSVTGLFIVAKTDFDKYKGSFENAVKKYTSKGIQELFGATRLKDVPAKAFGEATKAVLEAAPLMPVVSQFVGFVFGRFVDKAVDTVNNKILAHEIDNLKGMGVDPALITAIQGNQNLNLRFVIHAAKIPSLYEEVDGLIKETTSQILEIKKKQVNPKNPVAPKDLEQLFRLLYASCFQYHAYGYHLKKMKQETMELEKVAKTAAKAMEDIEKKQLKLGEGLAKFLTAVEGMFSEDD